MVQWKQGFGGPVLHTCLSEAASCYINMVFGSSLKQNRQNGRHYFEMYGEEISLAYKERVKKDECGRKWNENEV